jgi:aryl-alcohol dehydrogenase-like predicted oxidoreductase
VPFVELRSAGGSGLGVSVLGLGTMGWGANTDAHEARELLKIFADAGGTLVDTAASYGEGAAESVLGAVLGADPGLRRPAPRRPSWRGRGAGGTRVVDLSRRGLLAALDASLDRLDVDHVDLWQLQAFSDAVPLAETLSAGEIALATGRARYVGVAGVNAWQLALSVATASGSRVGSAAVTVGAEYSLLNRIPERDLLAAARQVAVGCLAWSPLGRGVLTGKYRAGTPRDSRGASGQLASFVERYLDDRGRRVVEGVATAAEGLGLSPAQVSLAWVLGRPGVTAVLVGPRTVAQLRELLPALGRPLPAEIVGALDEVSAT